MSSAKRNQEIEALVKSLGDNPSAYSEDQKAFIRTYSGSGGLGAKGATGEGVLYEFYTPKYLSDHLWRLAYYYGFDSSGTVLDPAVGTGMLIEKAPDKSKVTAFEINPISASITKILNPGITLYNEYFETAFLEPPRFVSTLKKQLTWLTSAPFDLVISNPPYGKYRNKYSSYFSALRIKQIELFFMIQSMKLLRSGGILIALTSSGFMRNSHSYNAEKEQLSKLSILKTAYRLPPIFERSQVPTDILVFQRI